MSIVSIIVPIYNAQKKLSKCIKSIQKQTFKDIEIVLVNDGSTDNSLRICQKAAAKDSRIKIIDTVNRGCIRARRLGINVATSPYTMFVDSDDWVHKDMVKILHAEAIAHDADITVGNTYKVLSDRAFMKRTNKTEFMREHTYEGDELKKLTSAYLYGHAFPASMFSKLYKAELLVSSGKYLNRIHFLGEDLYFNLEMFTKANKVRVIPTPLYYYRAGGSTSKYMSYMFDDVTNGYKIQKEVIAEHYADQAVKQERGISMMLLNTLQTCLANVFNGGFSESKIRGMIILYINNPEILTCIDNGCVDRFSPEFIGAIRDRDVTYLYNMGKELNRKGTNRRKVLSLLAKFL